MDPITGFSRRALLALAGAVVLGIVAGTVATVIDARAEEACPDPEYGCAALEPGQPIVIGALFPSEEEGGFGVQAALLSRGRMLGHRLQPVSLDGRCSTEGAAEAARDFATEPSDGPPVVAVVGETCSQAEIPVAQILDDWGITFISAVEAAHVPVPVEYYLAGPGPGEPGSRSVVANLDTPGTLGRTELAAFRATDAVLDALGRVAVEDEGVLLVPRAQLRDALIEAGLSPAS